MNMSREMFENVYDMDVTIIATRYSTDKTPDIIVWFGENAYRATWQQDSENVWLVHVTEREIKNVLPSPDRMMADYLETY